MTQPVITQANINKWTATIINCTGVADLSNAEISALMVARSGLLAWQHRLKTFARLNPGTRPAEVCLDTANEIEAHLWAEKAARRDGVNQIILREF